MRKETDFKKLDAIINFNYRDDLYSILDKLGYKYVSQFVYVWYVKKKEPASKICRQLFVSQSQIYIWIQRFGFKARPRGGNVRNSFLQKKDVYEIICCLKGSMMTKDAAEFIGCSYSTIRNIWSNNGRN